MVVDQGYGSNHERVPGFQTGIVQVVADKVAKCLGPVVVSFVEVC